MSTLPLAMHMANELLSVKVAAATTLAAALGVVLAGRRARRTIDVQKLPLMGVMGAFVFAAQMINFPVLPGTSGHLVGAVLLAVLLGPWTAIVTVAAILIVQCLLFQDGGLLALGCNVINMGIVPSLLGWGVYHVVMGGRSVPSAARQYLAAWAGAMVGVVGGAALVPLETAASGVLRIPLMDFLAMMVGVHLLIGFVEGLITFAVLAYLRKVRPEALGLPGHAASASSSRRPARAVLASVLVTAFLLAGVVSCFASTHPDGLEWVLGRKVGAPAVRNASPAVAAAEDLQARLAPLPDYSARQTPLGRAGAEASSTRKAAWPNFDAWGSLAGVIGTTVTLGLMYLVAAVFRRGRAARAAPGCK